MIWNWEKSKLQIEDEILLPFDVGKAVLSEREDLPQSRACQPASQDTRKNVALPAGSWKHSFLFGTQVPDAHIIKLLNEDFVAHL